MIRAALIFAGVLVSAVSSANHGSIGAFDAYVIDGRFADPDRTSTLYRIDPDTGEVLETIGDTGLRLNAITFWPPTSSLLATTSLDDPVLPGHLIELDAVDLEFRNLGEFVPASNLPGPIGPSDMLDMAALERSAGNYSLAFFRAAHPDDFGPGLRLAVTSGAGAGLPSLAIEPLTPEAALPGGFPDGVYGLAIANWMDDNYFDLAIAGCNVAPVSLVFPPPPPNGDPPLPNPGVELPHPTCFASLASTHEQEWLAVGTDELESAPRRLDRVMLNDGQATTDELGALPDNTVGIAFGPAFPVEPVPALSRVGLIFLLALVALVAVLRVRGPRHRNAS